MSEERKPLLHAYLVTGDDELKRKDMLKAMESRIAEMGELELNMNTFVVSELDSVDGLASALYTPPFASEKRLVVIKGIENAKKPLTDILVDYLIKPCDSTVLFVEGGELPKSSLVIRAFTRYNAASIIECKSKNSRTGLGETVCKLAMKYGSHMGLYEAEKLIDMIGTSTVALDTEVKKLAEYAIAQGENYISSDAIDEMVVRTEEPKPWDVADAMSARDAKKVSEYLARMPEDSYFQIMSTCANRIRELLMTKSNDDCSTCGKTTGMVLGGPDWKYRNHSRWAAGFEFDELIGAFGSAADAEKAMKSGGDPLQALQTWLLGICEK